MTKYLLQIFTPLFLILNLIGCNANNNEDDFESKKIEVKSSQPIGATTSLVDSSKSLNDSIKVESGFYECGIKINLSKNYLDMYHEDGRVDRHTFKNNSRPDYGLTFDVKTKLNNDQFKIDDYYYVKETGDFQSTERKGIIVTECNTLTTRFYLYTRTKKMTGRFIIRYSPK